MMQRPSRPTGITILAILEILIGIIGLLASLAIIGLSALASTLPSIGLLVGTIGLVIGGVFLFFSLVWLATGFGFLHGKGWSWTLGMIFSVLSILGAVGALTTGLITGGIVGIFFWSLMIYYLTRTHVKAFFGKGLLPVNPVYRAQYSPTLQFNQQMPVTSIPSNAQPAPGTTPPGSTQPTRTATPISQIGGGSNTTVPSASRSAPNAPVNCPYCGNKLTVGSPKCLTCGAKI